jgi:hypothetical protein
MSEVKEVTGSGDVLDVLINSLRRKCTTLSKVSVEALLMALLEEKISTCISELSVPSCFSLGGTSLFRET